MDSKSPYCAPRRARLLLADDDPAIRTLAAFHLRDQGWDLAYAVDAGEALDACAAHEFDLLLLDLAMPGGGGEAVVRGLGEHGPRAIALSASCADEGFVLPAGFAGALPKPFTQQGLVRGIQAHLPAELAVSQRRPGVPNGHGGATDPALAPLLPRVYRSLRMDIEAAETALAQGAMERVRGHIHSMRGAAACYGLGDVAGEAEHLEHALAHGDAVDVGDVLRRMRALLADEEAG